MRTWPATIALVLAQPPGGKWQVSKTELPDVATSGLFRPSLGLPTGQRADWRFRAEDCRGVHVQDMGDSYWIHVDQMDPACDLVAHGALDAPLVLIAGSTALGALIGKLALSKKRGWKVGALGGLALGLEIVLAMPRRPAQ